jgi:transposase
MIRAAGARVFFLPPYSPDLNPIEQVFAKLKPECATPQSGLSKTLGGASARSSKRSRQTNAQTTSKTQAMLPCEYSTL